MPDIETMRRRLAERKLDTFEKADYMYIFLNGFLGYNHMADEHIIEIYNRYNWKYWP